MQIYLPIAEMSANMLLILGMGGTVGFLSGMFGVGGGFLMTPLLILMGIPPAVAVATQTNQIIASSVSGMMAHWRRGGVDIKLGFILIIGGLFGSAIGIWIFNKLNEQGQIDLVISLSYVTFLGTIGVMMLAESLRAIHNAKCGKSNDIKRPGQHNWVHGLPFKMRFKRAGLYISTIPIMAIGATIGLLTAIMGVGGGFIMIPALIYILRMPTNVVIGTSLFQILVVTCFVTFAHALTNQSVDIILALILMIGGVIGAQSGARAGQKLRGEQLRAMLALLVLAVCLRLTFDLIVTPHELFSLDIERRNT